MEHGIANALHAYLAGQLSVLDTQLGRDGDELHKGIHEARKAIRRYRALLRLVGRDSTPTLARLDRSLRWMGKGLSRLRDAQVVVALADARAADPAHTEAGEAEHWRSLRAALRAQRDTIASGALAADPGFEHRRQLVRRWQALHAGVAPATPDAGELLDRLLRSAARLRRAQRRVEESTTTASLHDWRRQARRLRMQLQALVDVSRAPDLPGRVATQLRSLLRVAAHELPSIDQLEALTDALGTEQDARLLQAATRRLGRTQQRIPPLPRRSALAMSPRRMTLAPRGQPQLPDAIVLH